MKIFGQWFAELVCFVPRCSTKLMSVGYCLSLFYRKENFMNEIEAFNRIYNLSLYLSYIERRHPFIFGRLKRKFDGLPGYTNMFEQETFHEKKEEN